MLSDDCSLVEVDSGACFCGQDTAAKEKVLAGVWGSSRLDFPVSAAYFCPSGIARPSGAADVSVDSASRGSGDATTGPLVAVLGPSCLPLTGRCMVDGGVHAAALLLTWSTWALIFLPDSNSHTYELCPKRSTTTNGTQEGPRLKFLMYTSSSSMNSRNIALLS